jgi:hypothetical protein
LTCFVVSLRALFLGPTEEIRRLMFETDLPEPCGRGTRSRQRWHKGQPTTNFGILAFWPITAHGARLYLFSYNSERKAVDAFVYSLEGRLEAILRFPEGIQSPLAVNGAGELFGIKDGTIIVRFKAPVIESSRGPVPER